MSNLKPACPACGDHYAALLGTLGNRMQLRCQSCGMDYSRTVSRRRSATPKARKG